jgi:spermidine synthase
MSPTDVLPEQASKATVVAESPLLAGVCLTSFAALLLELCLTRLFSVVLFYHFAFLAISVALLGLGAGGVLAHLQRERLRRWDSRELGGRLCLFSAIVIFLLLQIILHTSVSLHLSAASSRAMAVLYVAAMIPFVFAGLLFSIVFARHPTQISRLYGADLAGGALACLATVPLLNYLGGPNTVLFSAGVMAAAAAIWATDRGWRIAGLSFVSIFCVLIVINSVHPVFDVVYAKGNYRDPASIEYARWNAISRVEVQRRADGFKHILIDADSGTLLMGVDPHHLTPEWQHTLMNSAPSLANALRPHGEFAIIGPGGGKDVVRAVASGSPRVIGIEINPIIVNRIMQGRYAAYAHHLYDIPGVEIHVSDGRSFIRSSPDLSDVLQMTLVDTWASTSAGAFALSENSLYTVEAFVEYFQHLKPDGMIAVTRWEFKEPREALRVVSVAIAALHQLGVASPSGNFMVVSDGELNADVRQVLVLAKRNAFTPEEEKTASAHLAAYPNLVSLYRPDQPGSNPFSQLIASNDPITFALQYKFNVTPVYDDAPFFFFNLKLGQLLHRSVDRGIDWKVNLGIAVLALVLLISIAAVLCFLIVPLAVGTRKRQHRIVPLIYFVALGLGYILVEITFIQRFVLFLGNPTYALTVVVFLMLLSSGAGSLASRRWLPRINSVRWPLLAIVACILAYVFLLPALLSALVGEDFSLKLAISGALLVPLGFAMGMPFPAGLRVLAKEGSGRIAPEEFFEADSIEWAWAMNAAASVLGSGLAIVLAMCFGLSITLACGAGAYCLAAILISSLEPKAA